MKVNATPNTPNTMLRILNQLESIICALLNNQKVVPAAKKRRPMMSMNNRIQEKRLRLCGLLIRSCAAILPRCRTDLTYFDARDYNMIKGRSEYKYHYH